MLKDITTSYATFRNNKGKSLETAHFPASYRLTHRSCFRILKRIMKPVFIGKGMCRIIVRSKAKRDRLAKIPEVMVEGSRVIFPEWLTGNIRLILNPKTRQKKQKPEQTELF